MGSKKVGVLLSGGLDSAALVGHFLGKGVQVWPVYLSCNLPWEKAELYWAKKFLKAISSSRLKPLKILNLTLDGAYRKNWSEVGIVPGLKSSDRAVFLPGRNLLLAVKAALYLTSVNVSTLALATLKGNPFPDGQPTYFRLLGKILSQSFCRPIRILAPFRSLTKKQILNRYKNWPLHLSFSCINPRGTQPCGRCNKCAERAKSLKKWGK